VVSKEARGEEVREEEIDTENGFQELCQHLLERRENFIPIKHPASCFETVLLLRAQNITAFSFCLDVFSL
jgi:hypothetical protein